VKIIIFVEDKTKMFQNIPGSYGTKIIKLKG